MLKSQIRTFVAFYLAHALLENALGFQKENTRKGPIGKQSENNEDGRDMDIRRFTEKQEKVWFRPENLQNECKDANERYNKEQNESQANERRKLREETALSTDNENVKAPVINNSNDTIAIVKRIEKEKRKKRTPNDMIEIVKLTDDFKKDLPVMNFPNENRTELKDKGLNLSKTSDIGNNDDIIFFEDNIGNIEKIAAQLMVSEGSDSTGSGTAQGNYGKVDNKKIDKETQEDGETSDDIGWSHEEINKNSPGDSIVESSQDPQTNEISIDKHNIASQDGNEVNVTSVIPPEVVQLMSLETNTSNFLGNTLVTSNKENLQFPSLGQLSALPLKEAPYGSPRNWPNSKLYVPKSPQMWNGYKIAPIQEILGKKKAEDEKKPLEGKESEGKTENTRERKKGKIEKGDNQIEKSKGTKVDDKSEDVKRGEIGKRPIKKGNQLESNDKGQSRKEKKLKKVSKNTRKENKSDKEAEKENNKQRYGKNSKKQEKRPDQEDVIKRKEKEQGYSPKKHVEKSGRKEQEVNAKDENNKEKEMRPEEQEKKDDIKTEEKVDSEKEIYISDKDDGKKEKDENKSNKKYGEKKQEKGGNDDISTQISITVILLVAIALCFVTNMVFSCAICFKFE